MACSLAPWVPDPAPGQLVFLDVSDYTLPNYAVRPEGLGTMALEVMTLTIESAEWSRGDVAHEATGHRRRVGTLPLQLTFLVDAAGDEAPSLEEGWATNWDQLEAIADLSTVGEGTQQVRYVAWPGATPVTLIMKIDPPVLKDGAKGQGVYVDLGFTLYNPSVIA